MQYTIKLSQMEFRALHGCYDLEQKVGNRFSVDVEITASAEDIAADDIEKVANYLTIYQIIEEQMRVTQRTIEAVAHNIISAIKSQITQVGSVKCEVAKLAPPLGGKIARVSVIIEG